MPDNIVLVGFMGSGKSTCGRILAADLGWKFIDTDELIAAEAGMPVKEIFARHSEVYFRALEQETVARTVTFSRTVIATGGGVVLSPVNVQHLRQGNKVVWLQVDLATALARTRTTEERPLLQGQKPADIARLWRHRQKYYQFADLWLNTATMSPDEVAAAIKEALKQWLAELK
ncbi:MAG: shikimate kinase [Clostridia bacterium]|nr:shikimate kinase [Clostridia bacterium]